jgi:hypothetical protein
VKNVAGLADCYWLDQEHGERRGLQSSIESADWTKNHLLNSATKLSREVLAHEIAQITELLQPLLDLLEQDQLEWITPLIELMAEGLFISRVLYGHPDIGRPNHLYGWFERWAHQVKAFYHNGFGLLEDLGHVLNNGMLHNGMLQDLDQESIIRAIVLAMVGDAWADTIYGEGRRRDNPDGYDERASSGLLFDRARLHGIANADALLMAMAVNGTGYNEDTGEQLVQDIDALLRLWELNRVQWGKFATIIACWVAAVDLQILSEPDSVERFFELLGEDLMFKRFNRQRVLGRRLRQFGVRPISSVDALQAMDTYGTEPEPLEPGVYGPWMISANKAGINRMRGNGYFHDPRYGYVAPDGWLLHCWEARLDHAAWLRQAAERKERDPSYTWLQANEDAKKHTEQMRQKYAGFRWEKVIRLGEQPWNPITIANTLAAQLPGSDQTSRDVINAALRLAKLAQPVAAKGAAIVVTRTENADRRPILRVRLEYTRPDRTQFDPRLTRQQVLQEVSGIVTTDRVPRDGVVEHWHRIVLDFEDPVDVDGLGRGGAVGRSVTETTAVPSALGAKFLVEGVLGSVEYTDRLAPVFEEVIARSGATQLQINHDTGIVDDVVIIRTRTGDWSLVEEVDTTWEDDPLPTEFRVELPGVAADDVRALLIACLPDAQPQFVDTVVAAVADLPNSPLAIVVTRPIGHRAVEITAAERRLLFFEEGVYTYQPRLSDSDFEHLAPKPLSDEDREREAPQRQVNPEFDESVQRPQSYADEARDRQAHEALRELLPVHADLTDPANDPADSIAEHTLRHDILVAAALPALPAGDDQPGTTVSVDYLVLASGIPTVSENEVLAFVRLPAGTPVTRDADGGQLHVTTDVRITRTVHATANQPLRV